MNETEQAAGLVNYHLDKSGAELDRQRFQMLKDIAGELSSRVVFPTSFDVVMRVREALQDPEVSLDKVVAMVTIEPLLSVRVLALANSTVYNPTGKTVCELKNAIARIGLRAVRIAALAIAMKQLLLARNLVAFRDLADQLWQHSLRSASASYVVAKRMSRVSPDEALLAGMVHDIGAFYMIYRAAQYEELTERPESARYLILRWHESVGHTLALALGLPREIADAILDHDQPRPIPNPPRNLADVVYLGNLLAGGRFEWMDSPVEVASAEMVKLEAIRADLKSDIDSHEASLRNLD